MLKDLYLTLACSEYLSNFPISMIDINCLHFPSLKKITFASFIFRVVDERLVCINFDFFLINFDEFK